MTRFLQFLGAPLKNLCYARVTVGRFMAGLSLLGFAALVYLGGAAAMFFQLPSSDFLNEAFAGAKAWHKRGRSSVPFLAPDALESETTTMVSVDNAERTYDGFTLYTMTNAARGTLVDMQTKAVHRWELPFREAWYRPPHITDPLPNANIYWFHTYLYPNGDLLAIYHGDGDTPYGYGLVKVDKDSKLLWAYADNVHHDVDVAEDGTIYTLTHKIIRKPPAGLEFLSMPCLTDSLVILSPEGQELETIPLLEAFAQSLYAPILNSVRKQPTFRIRGRDVSQAGTQPLQTSETDLLHTNSVKVLNRALAEKFPLFQAGQVLLSLRNIDTIAVLDRSTRRIVWATQGIWHTQHDAEFLNNGHLLVYDNFGSMAGTRILEYDPLTQAIPWLYANEKEGRFLAIYRGVKQRLPNGNTLIVDPDHRRFIEVTLDKEIVWESAVTPFDPQTGPPKKHSINYARRYGADELTFLKGLARARP
jgi:hypothetical protein